MQTIRFDGVKHYILSIEEIKRLIRKYNFKSLRMFILGIILTVTLFIPKYLEMQFKVEENVKNINHLTKKVNRKNKQVAELRKDVVFYKKFSTFRVDATCYNSEIGQTDSTPFKTADGSKVKRGGIAVSWDLKKIFPFGTKLRVVGVPGKNDIYVVNDLMNERFRKRIDVWKPKRSENFSRENILIYPVRTSKLEMHQYFE